MPQFKGLKATRIHSSVRPKDIYEYIFATRQGHEPILTLADLQKQKGWNTSLALYWNGIYIGSADLEKRNWRKKWIHTDGVGLEENYRRKGHGIALYIALIDCATALGAKRLYSSTSLNKFSGRMWGEKLGKAGYDVKMVSRGCRRPCNHCKHRPVYYINL